MWRCFWEVSEVLLFLYRTGLATFPCWCSSIGLISLLEDWGNRWFVQFSNGILKWVLHSNKLVPLSEDACNLYLLLVNCLFFNLTWLVWSNINLYFSCMEQGWVCKLCEVCNKLSRLFSVATCAFCLWSDDWHLGTSSASSVPKEGLEVAFNCTASMYQEDILGWIVPVSLIASQESRFPLSKSFISQISYINSPNTFIQQSTGWMHKLIGWCNTVKYQVNRATNYMLVHTNHEKTW